SGLIDYRWVHLTGSVKLLELPIGEKQVPNFFLNAFMVSDQVVSTDQAEVIVPPIKNFLSVNVEPDRKEYRPGQKGTLRVRTLDADGKPVSAEVALSVADESIFYIQPDYAGDPRKFFFGEKRAPILNVSSSFNYRAYRRVPSKLEEEEAVQR